MEVGVNYFPFHIGDYAANTAHLEPMEDLAYRRMLDLYYLKESPLPADATQVARLIRMRSNVESVEIVLSEFFVLGADGWFQERCNQEIAHMQDKQAKAKAAAEASVNARKAYAKSKQTTVLTDAERTLNGCSTDVELPTPTPTPTPTPVNSVAIATASEAGKKAADADSADKTLPKPAHDLTKVELWAAGKSILAQQGMPKAQCGSFVGKLVKDYGDTIVIEAVRAAVVQQPADVAQYLKATCQHGFGTRKPINKQEALEARNRAVGEAWATEMEAKQGANLETV